MLKFLTGDEIADATKRNIIKSGPTDLAVAYWGKGAAKRLGLDENNKNVRILCDVFSLSCNPAELDYLLECGFEIKTISGFHAKVYLTETRAVIGSANASMNGLGDDEAVNLGLEAALETDCSVELEKVKQWFRNHWKTADEVDQSVVERVRSLWKLRIKTSLYAALVASPAQFKGQSIYFAFFEDRPDTADDYEAAWSRVKSLYDPAELKRRAYGDDNLPIYLDRTGLNLKAGDYLINYWVSVDARGGVSEFEPDGGVWRVKGTRPIDERRPRAGDIVYTEAVNTIANMRASDEYKQLGEVFHRYFEGKKKFEDHLIEFSSLPHEHSDLFDSIKIWQKEKSQKVAR